MYTYNLPKKNDISFNIHHLVIAYYVYMYSVTLCFLFSSPCQTWWWPYRKGPKHVVYLLTLYTLIKFCCVLTYAPYIN